MEIHVPLPHEITPPHGESVVSLDLWFGYTQDFREPERCASVLSLSERNVSASFRREQDRRDYVFSHSLLRGVLSQYLHQSPASICFETGPFGKPHLTGAQRAWEFNLAHTTGLAAVAVSMARPVGVDVECRRREIEFLKIARMFSSAEYDQLSRLTGCQQEQAFWTLWTSKEAYIKARGLGLSLPLDSFEVELSPPELLTPPRLKPAADDPCPDWSLHTRQLPNGYCLALASPQRDQETIHVTERMITPDQLWDMLEC